VEGSGNESESPPRIFRSAPPVTHRRWSGKGCGEGHPKASDRVISGSTLPKKESDGTLGTDRPRTFSYRSCIEKRDYELKNSAANCLFISIYFNESSFTVSINRLFKEAVMFVSTRADRFSLQVAIAVFMIEVTAWCFERVMRRRAAGAAFCKEHSPDERIKQ
jgi:hypothetical protein